MYTKPAAPDYVDVKGIQLVRRDNCPLVKDVSTAVLDAIMYDKNTEAALDAARQHVVKVLSGDYPVDKFVVSKSLRGDYKNAAQPHVHVAAKLASRRGYPVPTGSRVPYVFVENLDAPLSLQAERAEDPQFVVDNDLPLDVLYYLEHQIKSPVCALLDVLVDDAETSVFDHESIKPAMDELRRRHQDAVRRFKRVTKNTANRQLEITTFFRKA
jgi:DNA polymerase delta subunit 1